MEKRINNPIEYWGLNKPKKPWRNGCSCGRTEQCPLCNRIIR